MNECIISRNLAEICPLCHVARTQTQKHNIHKHRIIFSKTKIQHSIDSNRNKQHKLHVPLKGVVPLSIIRFAGVGGGGVPVIAQNNINIANCYWELNGRSLTILTVEFITFWAIAACSEYSSFCDLTSTAIFSRAVSHCACAETAVCQLSVEILTTPHNSASQFSCKRGKFWQWWTFVVVYSLPNPIICHISSSGLFDPMALNVSHEA